MEINVPVEMLRANKLFVATPMYGGMCAGMFAKSTADLSAICTQYGIPVQFYYLFNESLITRARNYCVDEFMRSDAEHLMFIDSDIGFNPQDVIALMALQAQEPEKYDIIGGPYPKKCISWEKIKLAVDKGIADEDANVLEKFVGDYVFNPKSGAGNIPISEPVEVLEIGTGFMMISKNALKKFVAAYPKYHYKPDHIRTEAFDGSREILQFFQAEIDQVDFGQYYAAELKRIAALKLTDPGQVQAEVDAAFANGEKLNELRSKRYLSEDYWFCQKVQAIGLKTWFCPWMKMQHVGTYIFGGSLADLASIGASATADPTQLGGKKKK
jgi:glycosyltransferase involved in cell wall biosynthesis